jgi:hypothetical protein
LHTIYPCKFHPYPTLYSLTDKQDNAVPLNAHHSSKRENTVPKWAVKWKSAPATTVNVAFKLNMETF